MNNSSIVWMIFFSIMIPSNLIFNYWYAKNNDSNRIVVIVVGFAIGMISMLISMYIVGEI